MKILVACEESQAVTIELRKLGHEAYSCDIMECSGGHPEWHIKDDVVPLLNQKWDMIIAFPPCTHLALSGARHFVKKREDGRQGKAIEFFMRILNADCEKIAVENPMGIIGGGKYIKEHFPELALACRLPIPYNQKIQPYEFGHTAQKTTCLWLKGLPKLMPTEIVEPEIITLKNGKKFSADYMSGVKRSKAGESSRKRSKTYSGIAKAMAKQWAGDITKKKESTHE